MSRTLEVLERLRQDQELFRVPSLSNETSGRSRPSTGGGSFSDPDGYGREEVLRLIQRLFLPTPGEGHQGPRGVVFCGIDEGNGSNLLCVRLGRSLSAQVQSQVCVVDSNMRVSGRHYLFDLPSTDQEPLSEHAMTPKFTRRITENLCLLSRESITADGGVPTIHQLQTSIIALRNEFTHWVISAAPVGLCSDACLLGQMAEGVVLVLEANSTRRAAARKAKQSLEGANVRVLGTVLNSRTYPIPENIYRRL